MPHIAISAKIYSEPVDSQVSQKFNQPISKYYRKNEPSGEILLVTPFSFLFLQQVDCSAKE